MHYFYFALCVSYYQIIVLLLLMSIKVFFRVQFLLPYFFPCILSLFLPLMIHTIMHHLFADDIQLQTSAPPDEISELFLSVHSCIGDAKTWATYIFILTGNKNK